MRKELTKAEMRTRLNLESDAALARFFGVTSAAVAQWPEDKPLPELRQLQAEKKRPDLFAADQPAPVAPLGQVA